MQLKSRSKRTKNINKIITNKREIKKAKKIKIKIKKTNIEIKTTKTNIKANTKANTIATTIITTTTIDRKYLLKLYKQFVCIYINFVLKIASILLNCLLLFNNL